MQASGGSKGEHHRVFTRMLPVPVVVLLLAAYAAVLHLSAAGGWVGGRGEGREDGESEAEEENLALTRERASWGRERETARDGRET